MKSKVAVVGAGLVGTCVALALARQGFQVCLIERDAPTLHCGRLGMDIRNVALSPASRQLLDGLGVWRDTHTAAYQQMLVWEQWGNSKLVFDAAEVGRDALGWLAEVSPLAVQLWSACAAAPNLEVQQLELTGVAANDNAVQLAFANASEQSFDFVIAADGARSSVRKALALPVFKTPTNQMALATVVTTEKPHQHTAWQRFLVDGPLALLPGADAHHCSVVWSQSPPAAARRMAMADDEFLRDLSVASEYQLGQVQAVDRCVTFPLTQQRVQNCYPHARVLLIGDAMRVVHPLAGLGVNLGFEDVAQLIEVAAKQQNLAYSGLWRRFARQRQARSAAMITTLDLLNRVYGWAGPSGALLRNTGVSAFNALPGLKRQVMHEAMGLGPLSRSL